MTDWPDLSGRLADGGHVLPVRVYYEDTDFSGFVYHGSYIRFMERGRSDFLRLLGVAQDEMAKGEHGENLVFAVRRITVDFLRPARMDDLLEVETRCTGIEGVRIHLAQTIRRGEEKLVTADVMVVVITTTGQLRRVPKSVAGQLLSEGRFTVR